MTQFRFVYSMGLFNAIAHLIVGIIWEQISLPRGHSPLLALPYFGGYLILVAIALFLVFIYLHLALNKQPQVPSHLQKFYLLLSAIVFLGSLIVVVVLCVRANDYSLQKSQIAKRAYQSAVVLTILDILLTCSLLPPYGYVAIRHYKRVKLTDQLKEVQINNSPNLEGQIVNQQEVPPSDRALVFNNEDAIPSFPKQQIQPIDEQQTPPKPGGDLRQTIDSTEQAKTGTGSMENDI